MWLWVVVAVAAAVHAAVIDENENRRIRDAKDEIFNKYTRLRQTLKKERSSGYPLLLSFLLSGILAFMFVKLSVFVGLHYQILLVLCHTGKERKCLHHGFNPDFLGIKKIMCFLNYVSFANLVLHRFDNCQVCIAEAVWLVIQTFETLIQFS